MSEQDYNLIYLIKVILKWKKALLWVILITFTASLITALLLPVYYKSTCVIYPFNPKAYDPKFILMENPDFEIYGNNQDVERIISTGKSTSLANYIIDKFGLIKAYKVDTTNSFYRNYALEEFRDNYKIIKNELGGIEISVYDQDRDKAAAMVNEVVYQIDLYNRQALAESNRKMYSSYKEILNEKAGGLDSLARSYKDMNTNNPLGKEILAAELVATFSRLKQAEAGLSVLNQNIQTIYIVEPGMPAEKKSSPFITLIVLASVIGSVTLALLSILLVEYYQSRIKQAIYE